ncbi:dihydrolipoamide acetyltransferase family protein [Luteibaculum oceani]|uniref:Dihydrolipoamide acetyltransferase component of pyruvate dehydrogenase complex n=1 Tax=Luteibaculum oceani TaxID=1294296 RepID=A0A5C6V9C4_9FLAO|nr:dihydrolipoamide acetyltransferase family protein [Luteibaculum oceani]TXC82063.1 2-oxo acid dehydrogenase subunit E2 [Luteibaculum oceani]
MGKIEILLPKMGESVAEATVTGIVAEVGATVEADDPIIEIATDKVDSEVPAPEDGTIVEILVAEGDVVEVGKPIAIMEVEGAGDSAGAAPSAPKQEPVAEKAAAKIEEDIQAVEENIGKTGPSGKFYSPLVRSIAKEENISMAELEQIEGTGAQGRVTKDDILAYVENRSNGSAPAAAPAPSKPAASSAPAKKAAPSPEIKAPAVSVSGSDEIQEMGRMRKLIADHMVMSKRVSPHVTSFVEADVTNLVQWRDRVKKDFLKREGEKITFTPIFIEAIANAIKEFPEINISVKDDNKIVYRKNINVGMATALPSGDLIVPVIKNADRYNLVGLTKEVNDLANRARINKLKPEEIQDGTYTVTNVGSFGNVFGTPIINQPQVAIMAVGAIKKKPAVIETPSGDMIGIRHFMMLSHSYDHRVVDGALGGKFVRRVADLLESFDPNREI